MKKFISTLNACKGKYVALLEGDDYWIEPDKLEQVDLMESHQKVNNRYFSRSGNKDVTEVQENQKSREMRI